MKPLFDRLVRFKDTEGNVLYGEAPADVDSLVGRKVAVYAGNTPWNLQKTNRSAEIVEVNPRIPSPRLTSMLTTTSQVLCPLAYTPIIYGVGLNYRAHIAEGPKAHEPPPPYPIIFTKPPDALNGPYSSVVVNPQCSDTMDYEGELTIVLGRDCKDITTPADAFNVILGYTVGNDVSCRQWQRPDISGNQHGYAKSFDGFAPLGPVLVSSALVPADISSGRVDLELVTRVNGEERQRGRTGHMIFNIADIIMHLSRATTLRAGTVIMTGTPEGVALSMKPPGWVQDGDEVEISIEGLGSIKNKHVLLS